MVKGGTLRTGTIGHWPLALALVIAFGILLLKRGHFYFRLNFSAWNQQRVILLIGGQVDEKKYFIIGEGIYLHGTYHSRSGSPCWEDNQEDHQDKIY
ncbi:hypothetical protein BVX98_01225 [bacterium F11]|nr:hypothetical protein BVX98_01225 [bacterium F11]